MGNIAHEHVIKISRISTFERHSLSDRTCQLGLLYKGDVSTVLKEAFSRPISNAISDLQECLNMQEKTIGVQVGPCFAFFYESESPSPLNMYIPNPHGTPPGPDALQNSVGACTFGGMVTGRIEPCITKMYVICRIL
jgi:hypothetical protein